jgi:hypothetical protein
MYPTVTIIAMTNGSVFFTLLYINDIGVFDNPIKANAASTRGFVVEAKPQRKSRRCAWPC